MRLVAKSYASLIVKVTSYSNCPIKLYGGQTAAISDSDTDATVLRAIWNSGTFTIDISKYDYIYITGTSSTSGYARLEFTFS